MTNNPDDRNVVYVQEPQPATNVVVQRERKRPGFFVGIIVAVVLAVVAAIVFLAVSDSDDDGNLDVDVPAVDVDAPAVDVDAPVESGG